MSKNECKIGQHCWGPTEVRYEENEPYPTCDRDSDCTPGLVCAGWYYADYARSQRDFGVDYLIRESGIGCLDPRVCYGTATFWMFGKQDEIVQHFCSEE